MKHPVHEYTYVRHVCTRRLSAVLLKGRSGSGFIHTSIYRSQHRFIGVDPRATLGSARVQDPKKGHFGAVTEEDGRIS